MEMQINEMKGRKLDICFVGILIVATFLGAGFTLHDMQTSQGTGLYLAMLWGHTDRTGFDILVDAFGMVSDVKS